MRYFIGLLISGLTVLFLAAPARAITVDVNGPAGHDCYLATLRPPSPDNDRIALHMCDAAVESEIGPRRDRAIAYINRSEIRLCMHDYAAALNDAERGLDLYPSLAEGYLNRGAALIGSQRYDEALAALDISLERGLRDPELAYFDRGLANEYIGNYPGAYADYHKALDVNPKFDLPLQQLARFTVVKRLR